MKTIATLIACVALLLGCATLGRDFSAAALQRMQPGVTTLADASALLGGAPMQTVRHDSGQVTQRWQYIAAGPVGVVANKSVTLIFDAAGRLVRVGHLINVPVSEADRVRLRVMAESNL